MHILVCQSKKYGFVNLSKYNSIILPILPMISFHTEFSVGGRPGPALWWFGFIRRNRKTLLKVAGAREGKGGPHVELRELRSFCIRPSGRYRTLIRVSHSWLSHQARYYYSPTGLEKLSRSSTRTHTIS